MGYSLSWIALGEISPDEVNRRFNLAPTGEREEFPESDIVSVVLPNDLYLIVFNQQFYWENELGKISDNCELIFCTVEEHIMFSSASKWNNGKEIWSVIHDAQKNVEHLDSFGDLPTIFPAIKNELYAMQKKNEGDRSEVDYIFDIPIIMAQKITGYRHDHDIWGVDEEAFEVLERI